MAHLQDKGMLRAQRLFYRNNKSSFFPTDEAFIYFQSKLEKPDSVDLALSHSKVREYTGPPK